MLGWALGLSLLAAPATAQTFPKLAGNPVVDQADIIPSAEEAALNTQLLAIEQKTGHQFVVATVSDLEGNDISDYGYKLGRAWGIGDEAKDDGVVFLIAPNERRMNISVGYGLEPI
ncbi:MAG: TPM domain-containing protein, partial [Beijerinckiaceae bacterium]|nr:TPM domain-containing protein [Beijerinckiaceae bacterium]